MSEVTFAAIQMQMSENQAENLQKAQDLINQAAQAGANLILLPELFYLPYFCKTQRDDFLLLAKPLHENKIIGTMQKLARQLKVVLPITLYELAGLARFNTMVVINADGKVFSNIYRKSHIPDGSGYCEKFYFSPGNSGFQTWQTAYGVLGGGICWDQWFSETTRIAALMGAEFVVFPSAIGSEPLEPDVNSAKHWQNLQAGQAAANLMPYIASNRVGTEMQDNIKIEFYGASFIADPRGELVKKMQDQEGFILQTFDLSATNNLRHQWGLFRDRRPDLYQKIHSL